MPVKPGLPSAPVQLLNPVLWWRGGRSFSTGPGQPRLLDPLLPGAQGVQVLTPTHALTVPAPLLPQERPPLSSPSCCCSSSSPWWLLSGTSGGLKGESGLLGAVRECYPARTETLLAGPESLDCVGQTSRTAGGVGAPFTAPRVAGTDPPSHTLPSAKGFQHQRMTNGAMNVEIGNPTYKMYEGEPDDDVGELLDADFALDPDKVRSGTAVAQRGCQLHRVQPKVGDAEGARANARGTLLRQCQGSLGLLSVQRRQGGSEESQSLWGWRLWGGTAAAAGSVMLYWEEVMAGVGSCQGTPGQGMPLGTALLGREVSMPPPTCSPLSAAHQLHQPCLRHAVHGRPQQPQLAG